MSESFNPEDHISNVKGNRYLEVKHRILWFRDKHPDGSIETNLVSLENNRAVVKAEVRILEYTGDGKAFVRGSATGYGSESASSFENFIEKAETKAVGRALHAMGFGTPATDDDDQPQQYRPQQQGSYQQQRPPQNNYNQQRPQQSNYNQQQAAVDANGQYTIRDPGAPASDSQKSLIGSESKRAGVDPIEVGRRMGFDAAPNVITKGEAHALIGELKRIAGGQQQGQQQRLQDRVQNQQPLPSQQQLPPQPSSYEDEPADMNEVPF